MRWRLGWVVLVWSSGAFQAAAQQAPATPPAAQSPAPAPAQSPAAEPTPPQPSAPAPTGAPAAPADEAAPPADSATPASPPPPAAEVETPAVIEARQHFRQGVAFAEAGNCSAAIVEFEAAYELVPRPNALYNIAQCQERLFRYDLAIHFYQRYLQEAPPEAVDRPAVEAALRTLHNLLGVLHVKSNVPGEVWIDDRLAGKAPGQVFVPAGGHTVELRAPGYIPERSEVRLVGRQELPISFQLVKARTTVRVTETTGLDPTLFWIGAGATAVTAGVGGFFALRALSLHDEALELPEVHPDRTQKRADVEDAEITADIFFASSVLLAVGTTIVFFVTDWDQEASMEPEDALEPHVSLAPVIAPRAFGLTLGGRL